MGILKRCDLADSREEVCPKAFGGLPRLLCSQGVPVCTSVQVVDNKKMCSRVFTS